MRNRIFKQIIYAFFYICFFIVFVFGAANIFFTNKEVMPSCSDGIQNQGEADIDCGGPCIACEILKLSSIQNLEPVKILHLNDGRVVLLGKILNPNENYGTDRFFYSFKLYDINNNLLEILSGGDSIFPAEIKYLYAVSAKTNFNGLGRVDLVFSKNDDINWKAAHLFLKPNLNEPVDLITEIIDRRIHVQGLLRNVGSVGAEEIKIIALISDKVGDDLFAMQTVVDNLEAFGEKTFDIIFPSDKSLTDNVDLKSTKVFINSR
ncbi:MAG: hypothetical protein QMD50_01720 [Patescibacteria group bacterium]|nr:hypothetical protein [Patescibacteria group bacterium]